MRLNYYNKRNKTFDQILKEAYSSKDPITAISVAYKAGIENALNFMQDCSPGDGRYVHSGNIWSAIGEAKKEASKVSNNLQMYFVEKDTIIKSVRIETEVIIKI